MNMTQRNCNAPLSVQTLVNSLSHIITINSDVDLYTLYRKSRELNLEIIYTSSFFKKYQNCMSLLGKCNLRLILEKHIKCKLFLNGMRKVIYLLFNNVHKKIKEQVPVLKWHTLIHATKTCQWVSTKKNLVGSYQILLFSSHSKARILWVNNCTKLTIFLHCVYKKKLHCRQPIRIEY